MSEPHTTQSIEDWMHSSYVSRTTWEITRFHTLTTPWLALSQKNTGPDQALPLRGSWLEWVQARMNHRFSRDAMISLGEFAREECLRDKWKTFRGRGS